MKTILSSLALVVLATPAAAAQDEPVVPFYGNGTCPVKGKEVDRRWSVAHDGQRIYTCCRGCWKKVRKDPATYLEKAYPEDRVKDLKLTRCPVKGKPIEDGGHSVVWQGHKVSFCCKGCAGKFLEEPNKRLTLILNDDVKAAGNPTCPVMTEEKAAPDLFFVYRKKLINICCESCVTDFQGDPEKYLKNLPKGR